MRLLLISNSTNAGEEYLGWPRQYIKDFLSKTDVKKVLFIPYAGVGLSEKSLEASYDAYEEKVKKVYDSLGYEVYSIHREKDPQKAVEDAEAIAVGGGNTFHLVHMLHKNKLIHIIREKVKAGMHYMGWSAGSNVACPSLKTTNDMPIIEPASFDCFNLIPFQINPHYLDANPDGHAGETRQQRIEEFMVVNREIYVAGLRESSLLLLEDDFLKLLGKKQLRLFKFGTEPTEYQPGSDLSFLLKQ
ncbi:MAG: dipeptidase PepE [Bacteroidales bacterium]|nr:dipeptidase PepE [Bacteroidales bacterium]MCF8388613.1 dipeptidase PepE [Bacteroidales bacterium]MCF8399188.1 dipeptidase PepE [Bacteroidales bacterium]